MNVTTQYPGSGIDAITWLAMNKKENSMPSLMDILKEVCGIFNHDIDKVTAKDRHKDFVTCRKIYCFVAYKITAKTLSEIGRLINSRDHTTVLHCVRTAKGLFESGDEDFIKAWNHYLKNTKYVIPDCDYHPEKRELIIGKRKTFVRAKAEYSNRSYLNGNL